MAGWYARPVPHRRSWSSCCRTSNPPSAAATTIRISGWRRWWRSNRRRLVAANHKGNPNRVGESLPCLRIPLPRDLRFRKHQINDRGNAARIGTPCRDAKNLPLNVSLRTAQGMQQPLRSCDTISSSQACTGIPRSSSSTAVEKTAAEDWKKRVHRIK